jgi:N-methylhydantoinase A
VSSADEETRFRISVDTGGTFTDVVVSANDGTMAAGKALTTYDRVFRGLSASVDRAARTWGMSGAEVLRRTDVIVYGTTHATNAVVTGQTATTALLVTQGFADTLTLREGGRRNVFDAHAPYPPPYVPRRLTFELRERVSAEGDVLEPLDEDHARAVIATLPEHGVEAVAVTLLWSIAEDRHEQRVGELLDEILPGVPYTLSTRANPSIREYRRASAASIDASLKPLMAAHLGDLVADLREHGFSRDLLVVTSEGGVLDVVEVLDRPVLTINSGPSTAPLVGAKAAPDEEVVVVCDMGGTTFDVSLVERGRVRHTREAWLGEPFVGNLTGLSSVAVQSIGAGGGSIAWIDGGGMLRVGPQSARSTPGPAAYGQGGELPTVTDACVLLGYLNAETFEAAFSLDKDAARRAITIQIAEPLGLGPVEAAQAILDVSVHQMANAIRQTTLEHGVDPRGALIVAGGGAGAMVAAALGDALDASRVVVPAAAGVLAAYGSHQAPVATEFLSPLFVDTRSYDEEAVVSVLKDLDHQAESFLARFNQGGLPTRLTYFVDARYPAQAWDLRVQLDRPPATDLDGMAALEQEFHREHERRNGIHDPGSRVEVLTWGVRAEVSNPLEEEASLVALSREVPLRTDDVIFGSEHHRTVRHHGGSVEPGQVISGPAIIDEAITTVVIPPGWRAELDRQRDLHLSREGNDR